MVDVPDYIRSTPIMYQYLEVTNNNPHRHLDRQVSCPMLIVLHFENLEITEIDYAHPHLYCPTESGDIADRQCCPKI